MYAHIAAGTDLSDTARIATDRAADLARRLKARLTLVHAGSDPGQPLRDLAAGYDAEVVVKAGNPADVLINETERLGADLLVVGSVGMSGARRFLLGSVPNKVSHQAVSDLLIVKTDPPRGGGGDYKKVMVGTDGSPTAMRAVAMTSRLCAALYVKPTIICVYEPPSEQELEALKRPGDPLAQWGGGVADVPDEFRWRIAAASQAEDVLERAVDHASRAGVVAEVRAVKGHPAEELISLAERESFDLICVGNVGMTGTKRFTLGNVPHRISHHAPTDLLILRTAG